MTYDHWKTTNPEDEHLTLAHCHECDGRGYFVKRITVYEPGCGFPHDDGEEIKCEECGGTGAYPNRALSFRD